MILTPPPVKEEALKHNIPVYQPKTLKDGEAFKLLSEIKPDVIIVVAYGKILPKEILELPRYGCINVHASLLQSIVERLRFSGQSLTVKRKQALQLCRWILALIREI